MLYGGRYHFVNFPGLFKIAELGNNKKVKLASFSGTELCLGPTSLCGNSWGLFLLEKPWERDCFDFFFCEVKILTRLCL